MPFPIIILTAAVIGFMGGKSGYSAFQAGGGHGAVSEKTVPDDQTVLGSDVSAHARPSLGWSLRISAIFLLLGLSPVALLAVPMPASIYTDIATFFSKMAVVTFGGAYAVLAYVAQQAVENYGWLRPGEMLDGLGMAETAPGPLIMVTQFVGFMGAARDAGGLDQMLAGIGMPYDLGDLRPLFLWIFLGASLQKSWMGMWPSQVP